MNPTRLAIRRPVTMLMVVLALMLMGIISYSRLPVQQLPNVTFPFVTVTVSYPGTTPLDMENLVTIPIENAISGVNGIQQMTGSSSSGQSRVSVQFALGTNVDTAANDISQAVSRISRQLPSDIQPPSIFKVNPNSSPIMNLALSGASPQDLYDTATDFLAPALEQVAGVASVQVQGGLVPQVNVTVKPDQLAANGLSLTQLASAITTQNSNIPGGATTEAGQSRSVTTNAYFQSAEDLRNLVIVNRPGGLPLTLGQVAEVQEGYAPVNQVTHLNGNDAVGLSITAQSGANIVAVDEAVRQKLATMSRSLPAGIKADIVNDQTVFTKDSIQAVLDALVLAVLLPALVLLLFLHRVRNTLIVVAAIPISLISTFTVMYFLGFSLDLISLLALSLLTGILVDDSIVVLENINRHLAMRKNPLDAAIEGRMEIGLAAVAITLTDIVVYAPVAFVGGLVGQIFLEFGLTIVAATLFSLFVSFTVTPLLASRWLKVAEDEAELSSRRGGGPWQRFSAGWERGYSRLRDAYARLIGIALRARPLVILIGVGSLALSLAFIPLGWLGTEFTPQEDNSQFSVNISLPNGTPLDQTNAVVSGLESQILQMPGVVSTYMTSGARGGGFGGGANTNSGQISVDLLPVGQRPAISDYLAKVRAMGRQFQQATITTRQQSSLSIGGGGGSNSVQVIFQGQDIDVLTDLASKAAVAMQSLPGVADVQNQAAQRVPQLSVTLDRAKAAEFGVTADQVGNMVRVAIAGTTAGNLRPSGSTLQTPIVLQLAGGSIMDRNQIAQLPLMTSSGSIIHLSQVAQVVPDAEPAQISDQNRLLQVTVSANGSGSMPLGEVSTEIQKAIEQMGIPNGYFYSFGGAVQQQQQTFGPLLGAFGLSALFVYMLTAALYESFLYPLAVLLSLPLATVGALGALTLTGNTLNLYSFMGLIMLLGLVAKNAILLVDFTNSLRSRGYSRLEALREAGRTRLRPILMTTSTMAFAMLPLAVKFGAGSESRSPMATVLVGGLLTSTLLTLVFVPVVYSYLDDLGGLLSRIGLMSRRSWMPVDARKPVAQATQGDEGARRG